MTGIISIEGSSVVPLASLPDSGSTDPRTLDNWAPRSQPRKLGGSDSGSGSPSAFVSSVSMACGSSTCSVFCRFSLRTWSPGSGDLDLFTGAESATGAGLQGVAGAGGFNEAARAVTRAAAMPLAGAGVAEEVCSVWAALSGGETRSILT